MGSANVVPKEKFMALNIYIRKEERFQVNNLSFHLRKTGKSKVSPKKAEGRKYYK